MKVQVLRSRHNLQKYVVAINLHRMQDCRLYIWRSKKFISFCIITRLGSICPQFHLKSETTMARVEICELIWNVQYRLTSAASTNVSWFQALMTELDAPSWLKLKIKPDNRFKPENWFRVKESTRSHNENKCDIHGNKNFNLRID